MNSHFLVVMLPFGAGCLGRCSAKQFMITVLSLSSSTPVAARRAARAQRRALRRARARAGVHAHAALAQCAADHEPVRQQGLADQHCADGGVRGPAGGRRQARAQRLQGPLAAALPARRQVRPAPRRPAARPPLPARAVPAAVPPAAAVQSCRRCSLSGLCHAHMRRCARILHTARTARPPRRGAGALSGPAGRPRGARRAQDAGGQGLCRGQLPQRPGADRVLLPHHGRARGPGGHGGQDGRDGLHVAPAHQGLRGPVHALRRHRARAHAERRRAAERTACGAAACCAAGHLLPRGQGQRERTACHGQCEKCI